MYARAAKLKNLRLRGLQMHIGSQLTSVQPFETAVGKMLPLVKRVKERHGIEFFSIGGGLGIVYNPALASGSPEWWQTKQAKKILTPALYASRLVPLLKPLGLRILMEPGRFISGNAGILVTKIEYVKRTGRKNFLIVDAAMNDLIRPTLYEAYHEIVPVNKKGVEAHQLRRGGAGVRIHGFLCEGPSAAESWRRRLPRAVERGRLRVRDGIQLQYAVVDPGNPGERKKGRGDTRTPIHRRHLGVGKNRAVAEVICHERTALCRAAQ